MVQARKIDDGRVPAIVRDWIDNMNKSSLEKQVRMNYYHTLLFLMDAIHDETDKFFKDNIADKSAIIKVKGSKNGKKIK